MNTQNGALGTIKKKLNRCTCVVETMEGVYLLVHAVADRKALFVPMTYGYAMTIRRAQGCTLEIVGLHFNRRRAYRGYAYVGASRVKRKADVYMVDHVRRTDWLPVGGDIRGPDHEQEQPSALSADDDSDERGSSSDGGDCEDSRDAHATSSDATVEADFEDVLHADAARVRAAVAPPLGPEHSPRESSSGDEAMGFNAFGNGRAIVADDIGGFFD